MSNQSRTVDLNKNKPGNYLSFDGGPNGLSGIPALHILNGMLEGLKADLKLDKIPHPCDWFGLFMGTGPGAVDAILLGRLRMSASQAIEAYAKLLPALTVEPAKDDEERNKNSKAFEAAFTQVLIDAGHSPDTQMLDDGAPKTAICTLMPTIETTPYIIRSYRVRGAPPPNFTILQAACASIASPDSFIPFVYGTGYKRLELTSAVIGYANPTRELLREAVKAFGKETYMGTLISYGAAEARTFEVKDTSRTATQADSISQLLASSAQVHRDMAARLNDTGIYFRFNTEVGFERDAVLSAYLESEETIKKLNNAITRLHQPFGSLKLEEINSASATSVALDPRPSVVPHFIGRKEILLALSEAHFSERTISDARQPRVSVLRGLGGSGKTQIALKIAHEFESKFPGVPVFFLDASSEVKLQDAYQTVIRAQGSSHRSGSYEDALIWLATRQKNWLVIMDNADDPSVNLYEYIPKSPHGHVIITTRNETYAGLAPTSTHHVEGLPLADSISLLLQVSRYENHEKNRKFISEIVDAVGYLPLAIAHAGAYISIHQCLPTYMKMYNQSKAKLLALNENVLPQDYRSSVATTIEISLEKLTERARDFMRLFSHLSATSIPLSVIIKAAKRQFRRVEKTEEASLDPETVEQADELMKIFCPGGEWSEFDFNESIHECLQYSLLQLTSQNDERFYSMHVLVQSHLQIVTFIHDHQPKRLISRLLGSAFTIGNRYEFLVFNRLLLPHIRLLQIDDMIEAGDHFGLGYVLHEVGDARLALIHQERCVEIWRERLGKEDECTLAAMADLARSYTQVGKKQAALELKEEVLSFRQQLLGPEHPDTLRAMGSLAVSYTGVGQNQVALELREEVLSLRRRVLGPEHPETLQAMGNLAASYMDVGKPQAALELEVEVLSLHTRLLGPEHPDTLLMMGNLALSYFNTGRHQEALKLLEEVPSLRRKLLGPEHPDTLNAMGTLAVFYARVGKNQAALGLDEEVLLLQKRLLGPEHPDTVRAMGNLSASYSRVGKNQAAMELQEEVLSLQKKLFGLEHPTTLQAMGGLAVFYSRVGKHQVALELKEEVLSLQKRVLGPEHPDTMLTMGNLSISYSQVGKGQAAIELEEEILSLRRRHLGPEHPDTLQAMINLIISYNQMGRNQAAMELQEEILLLQKRLRGPEHLDTLQTMGDLAVFYGNAGRHQAALELQEQVLSLRKRLLGPEHPDTLLAMSNLATNYTNVGKSQAAVELQEQILSFRKRLLGPEHPDTMLAMSDLAGFYADVGKNQAALKLDKEVLSLRKRLLGPEHPDTLQSMINLAVSYSQVGDNQTAVELREEVLSFRRRLLGPEHPETLQAMSSLAISYKNVDKYQAALKLEEEVLSLRTRILGPYHSDTLNVMWTLMTTYEKLDMQVQKLNLLKIAVPAHEAAEEYGVNHPDTDILRNELDELSAHLTNQHD